MALEHSRPLSLAAGASGRGESELERALETAIADDEYGVLRQWDLGDLERPAVDPERAAAAALQHDQRVHDSAQRARAMLDERGHAWLTGPAEIVFRGETLSPVP